MPKIDFIKYRDRSKNSLSNAYIAYSDGTESNIRQISRDTAMGLQGGLFKFATVAVNPDIVTDVYCTATDDGFAVVAKIDSECASEISLTKADDQASAEWVVKRLKSSWGLS